MFGTSSCDRKHKEALDDARYWQDRAERAEEQEREYQRQRDEQIEQSRRETRQRMQQAMMEAGTWGEAFQKQIVRVGDELRFHANEVAQAKAGAYDHCKDTFGGDPVAYWQKAADDVRGWLESVGKAWELYRAKMETLEKRHAEERKAALAELAEEVKKLPGEAMGLAEHLPDGEPSDWLYW